MRPETDPLQDAYEEWLAAAIVAGCAELDAGESAPAEEVGKELGLGG